MKVAIVKGYLYPSDDVLRRILVEGNWVSCALTNGKDGLVTMKDDKPVVIEVKSVEY